MKKIILFLTVVLATSTIYAQVSLGLKVGTSFASVQTSAMGMKSSTSNRTALTFGGYVNLNLSEKIKLQPELLYQGMGGSIMGETFKSQYVNLPILFQYAITNNLKIEAGPQFGLLLSSKAAGEDIKDSFKSSDFQLLFGASINLTEKIGVGARYGMSTSSIVSDIDNTLEEIDASVKNKAFNILISYKLF